MKRILTILAILGGAALAVPAGAVQWNSSSAGSSTACAGGTLCQMFMTSTSGSARVSAYSTAPAAPSGPGLTTGNWIEGNIFKYGGGFGISNTIPGDTNEGVAPEHAIDNNQVLDIIVVELPTLPAGMTWDFSDFKLGWAEENGSTNRWADVSAFIGGKGIGTNYDFRDVCFSGCTGTEAKTLASLGFSDVTGSITNPAGTSSGNACGAHTGGNDVCEGSVASFNTNSTGPYLVMAGRLGDQYDAFKLDMIKATSTTKVPEPGTLALLGLGLLGFAARRRTAA